MSAGFVPHRHHFHAPRSLLTPPEPPDPGPRTPDTARWEPELEPLLQDLRHAFRTLRTSPGFALTAILTLALGIGLATAVFTVADALLLRRLPIRDQDRVVVLWGERRDQTFTYPLGIDDAREFARPARSLERVAFSAHAGSWPAPVRDGARTHRLRGARARGQLFGAPGLGPVP